MTVGSYSVTKLYFAHIKQINTKQLNIFYNDKRTIHTKTS